MVTPANATLVRDLTLSIPCGTNLLVTGPNGSGKSSLFRVLGGLWPLTEGKMSKPGGQDGGDGLSHDIFYVPQRPYVTIGTLPDQLIYPLVQQGAQAPFPQPWLSPSVPERSAFLSSLLSSPPSGKPASLFMTDAQLFCPDPGSSRVYCSWISHSAQLGDCALSDEHLSFAGFAASIAGVHKRDSQAGPSAILHGVE